MPTAPKLIGALLFAALAWLVSDQIKTVLPEGYAVGLLSPVNALAGLAMGWRIIGARAGEGFVPAVGLGLTTIFAITLWCLVIWSAYEMVRRALRRFYDGPMEGLLDMADIMVQFAALVATPLVIGTAIIGGLICAMFTEYFAQRNA